MGLCGIGRGAASQECVCLGMVSISGGLFRVMGLSGIGGGAASQECVCLDMVSISGGLL